MAGSLSYHAAVKVLGGGDSRLAVVLDVVTTAGLAGWAAGSVAAGQGLGPALGLLELKNDVVAYAAGLIRRVSQWRSGLSRFDRSQRLVAAHSVLVVASFFEALGEAELPVPAGRLGLSAAEQAALATGEAVPDGFAGILDLLIWDPLPMPEPHRTAAETRAELDACYRRLSGRLETFAAGLSVWDEVDERARQQFRAVLTRLPDAALARYDANFRDLAVDNREFEVWAGMARDTSLSTALERMSSLLESMAGGGPGERPRAALRRSYRAALGEPAAGSADAPDDVVMPALSAAYLTPQCQVAEIGPGDRPAEEAWWDGRDVAPDAEALLAGYLTSTRAARVPLVVLGEPGSGKSALAQVLAGRLPDSDFLPVLVQLRDVAAESMIQEQVEQAIYRGPGEQVSWADLAEAAGGALPVVILDGFDEMVQATAVNRYDYLEQVRDFQLRQAQAGHPVAVVVTSRIVVADQARFPAGTVAMRLLPFTEAQVSQWLRIWAQHNAASLAQRGLRPLPAATALAHRELAEQPLLLLMLALFDAAGNALQAAEAPLGRAELYERLLTEFARREISKTVRYRALPAARQRDLAEREVHRLAIVALAMFTRGRQSATDVELTADLSLLFPDDAQAPGPDAALTPAERAAGRFFFIHRSQARPGGDRARSYEFLHTTFGEFLLARLTLTALSDLADRDEATRRAVISAGLLDDGFLHAVLSFSCLAVRAPVIGFLHELLARLPAGRRARFTGLLPGLIIRSLTASPGRSLTAYEPARHTVPRRHAVYSANLVILLVLAAGTATASDFTTGDPAREWAQYGYLWRSALTSAEWNGLTDTIRARATRTAHSTDIMLASEDGSMVSPADSIITTAEPSGLTPFDVHLSPCEGISHEAAIPPASLAGFVFRSLAFTPNWQAATLLLPSIPAIRALGGDTRRPGQAGASIVLPATLLAHLDYQRSGSSNERFRLYATCLENARDPRLLEQIFLRLYHDCTRFPADAICSLLTLVPDPPPSTTFLQLLNAMWRQPGSQSSRPYILACVKDLHRTAPDFPLTPLDQDLRVRITALITSASPPPPTNRPAAMTTTTTPPTNSPTPPASSIS